MRQKFLSFAVAIAVFAATVVLMPALIKGQGAPPTGQGGQAGAGVQAEQGGQAGQPARGGAQGRGGRGGGRGAPAEPAGPPPRLSNGKPDLNGNWSIGGGMLGNIANGIQEPEKVIPYTPVYKQLQAEVTKRMWEEPELHCYQSGVPSHMWRQSYNGAGLMIQHTPEYIVFLSEFMGARRIVPLDNRPHIPENIKLFMGDGVGRWEGDTLVIETTNNNSITWLDTPPNNITAPNPTGGNRHSDQYKVVERWTPIDANRWSWEAEISDPKAYTRPWKIASTATRNNNPNAEIMEFACIEGNKDHLVYTEAVGGRAKEAPIAAPAEFIQPAGQRGGGGGRGGAGAGRGGPAGGPPGGDQQ